MSNKFIFRVVIQLEICHERHWLKIHEESESKERKIDGVWKGIPTHDKMAKSSLKKTVFTSN